MLRPDRANGNTSDGDEPRYVVVAFDEDGAPDDAWGPYTAAEAERAVAVARAAIAEGRHSGRWVRVARCHPPSTTRLRPVPAPRLPPAPESTW